MKWHLELINAKYSIGHDAILAHSIRKEDQQYIIPVNLNTVLVKDLIQMEEHTNSEEGTIFLDRKTGKFGIVCFSGSDIGEVR